MKKNVIYISIMAALLASGPALAASGSSPIKNNHPKHNVAQSGQGDAGQTAGNASSTKSKKQQQAKNLAGITVTGIRQSQMHAIELKRAAPDIQDSITSVSIGQLPDITIANSLARITGVQIDRSAGEGTGINIRGLPEVTTTINGEAFITADNIYSDQPNYETLPSSLFAGADVIKSPTASILTSGISGTVNLRTRQPWNLPFGWTIAGTAEAGRGASAKKTKPDANALIGYNADGKWGVLLALSYSDLVHSFDGQGWNSETLAGENSSAANTLGRGYLVAWGARPGGVPSQIVTLPGGGVDVNGDGKSNGAFLSPTRIRGFNDIVQPKRLGVNGAFQYAFGQSLTLTADGFFTRQQKDDDDQGIYTLPAQQRTPTALPLKSEPTNVIFTNNLHNPGVQQGNWNQTFFTTQADRVYVGDEEPTVTIGRASSDARNFNMELKFDNGGALTGDLRWVNASAEQTTNSATWQFSTNNGSGWPNTLRPGVTLPATDFPSPGGAGFTTFNPGGIPPFTYAYDVNWEGENPVASIPSNIRSKLLDRSTYAVKANWYGDGNTQRAGMNVLRLDGHYHFSNTFSLDFGLRNNIRTARLTSYVYGYKEYAGEGASDPDGCVVRWTTADTILNGSDTPGVCFAGNQIGDYHGMIYVGGLSQVPSYITDNMVQLIAPGHTKGLVGLDLDPAKFRDPVADITRAHGAKNVIRAFNPATSWAVSLHTDTLYAQANFSGTLAGLPFRGNAGVRYIRTRLHVTQNVTGADQPYGMPQLGGGITVTDRQYTDILPAINVAIDLTPKMVLRFAGSKNMMPLSLDEWGGGFNRNFAFTILPNGQGVFAADSASSGGNPKLDPWRSTNFGGSLAYYFNKTTMLSLAAFRIRVSSFISSGTVNVCNIADEDGVVRRCIPLSEPEQGTGTTLHGLEFDYRQGLTFLPGLLSNLGFQLNGTLSPSDTGKTDMAGNPIPFPDNSKKSGNFVLWYQSSKLQIHAGVNYRSKRAVSADFNGINGMEEYQAPTYYVDASIAYQIDPHFQVFVQGQNLTNERQEFYLVWPNEKFVSRISEQYYFAGVRVKF